MCLMVFPKFLTHSKEDLDITGLRKSEDKDFNSAELMGRAVKSELPATMSPSRRVGLLGPVVGLLFAPRAQS